MIGTTLGHYEITGRLGHGGMGEVYEARDTRLGRSVAIKLLPGALVDDRESADRLDREARTIASLSHPHICTLFDVGVEGATRYLVMERIEGQTLADRIRERPLALEEALRFGAQIAQAVAAAHAKHVVHRDLKPGNVMITANGIKVLDFGLAKVTNEPEPLTGDSSTWLVTSPLVILGTAPYMSPEQIRGEPVDYRSDIWSFGVVLYEMLVGKRLFPAETAVEAMAAVLKETIDLSGLPENVPSAVRSMLDRILERDRVRRLDRMAAVAEDLSAEVTGRTSGGESRATDAARADRSIVVLPFANSSSDPENEYFSDGLTEEVISDLSKVGALRVIARTTAMRFKNTSTDLADVARTLDVRYALEGSVRKSGNSLRITAQLVDIPHHATMWSDKYGGTLEDVFAIQERVSRSIVAALRIQLSEDEDRGLEAPDKPNAYVYDTYLRARRDIWSFLPERLERAERELRHALTVAGDSPLLYSALGLVNWQYINAGISGDRRYLEEAERYAGKVMELDPSNARGPTLLGFIAAQSGDALGWIRHLSRAMAIDRHDPDTRLWLAYGWVWAGFPRRSRPLLHELLETDPLFDYVLWGIGFDAYFAGDYARAEEFHERARRLSPDHPGAAMVLVQTLGSAGQIARMSRFVDEHVPDPTAHPLSTLTHILKHAFLGEPEAADALVSTEWEEKIWSDFQYTHIMAQAQALLGRNDEAFRWLERSVSRGLINYPFLSERDPLIANLRHDERFRDLMDRVRRRWETFEADVDAG